MEQNKLKNSLAQTRSIATGLVIAFAASSCSIEPIMMSEDIARNPTVATAPQVADSPFNAAVAWQVSSEDGDEEATKGATLMTRRRWQQWQRRRRRKQR